MLELRPDPGFDLLVAAHARPGVEIADCGTGERPGLRDLARESHRVDHRPHLRRVLEPVEVDGGRVVRIGRPQPHPALARRSHERRPAGERVPGVGAEAVVEVVGRAEKQLEVRPWGVGVDADERAGLGDVRAQFALAAAREVLDEVLGVGRVEERDRVAALVRGRRRCRRHDRLDGAARQTRFLEVHDQVAATE